MKPPKIRPLALILAVPFFIALGYGYWRETTPTHAFTVHDGVNLYTVTCFRSRTDISIDGFLLSRSSDTTLIIRETMQHGGPYTIAMQSCGHWEQDSIPASKLITQMLAGAPCLKNNFAFH